MAAQASAKRSTRVSERGLVVIDGGRPRTYLFGGIRLVVSPFEVPPFIPEARVLEEDTWRLMSAPPELEPTADQSLSLVDEVINDRPARPGSVLVARRGLLAIIYDFDAEPVCREAWVAEALDILLKGADRLGLESLALPLFGSVHGGLAWWRSLELLIAALVRASAGPHSLKRIWLQIPPERREPVTYLLKPYAAEDRHAPA